MATRASIGSRRTVASQSIDQSIQSIAAGLKLDVPEQPPAQFNRDPDLRHAAQHERIASFLAVVASKVGKHVEVPEAQGAADANAVPEPAVNEPPHTQTISPDPSIHAMRDGAGVGGPKPEVDNSDEPVSKIKSSPKPTAHARAADVNSHRPGK